LDEIDVHSDLGESDLVKELSFITELKSARTDDDILDVSVRFEFDCEANVIPTISSPFLADGDANFSLLSSSDDMESPPEPAD
jgi:hypothetical protein